MCIFLRRTVKTELFVFISLRAVDRQEMEVVQEEDLMIIIQEVGIMILEDEYTIGKIGPMILQ